MKDDARYYFKSLNNFLKVVISDVAEISEKYDLVDAEGNITQDFRRCILHYLLAQLNNDLLEHSYFYLYTPKTILNIKVPDTWPKERVVSLYDTHLRKINRLVDYRFLLVEELVPVKKVMWGQDIPQEIREALIIQHYSKNRIKNIHLNMKRFCKKNGLYEMEKDFKVYNIA